MTDPQGQSSLSVIVATRARSEACRRLCAAVEDQVAAGAFESVEIILVFDGCEPYSWVPANGRYVSVGLTTPAGIAGARNRGLEASSGSILAFLDDDCVPAADWLIRLAAACRRYPERVGFGGRVFASDKANLFSQLRDQVYYRETFGQWYTRPEFGGDQLDPPYVNGGNCAYRRSAILDVGGFDGALPAYSDVELGRRLAGRGLVLVDGLHIHHDHPSTLGQHLLRCVRSGRARGLLWRSRGYQRDSPRSVAMAILANLVWRNGARRARRVRASWMRSVLILTCQEVAHGFGYAAGVVAARRHRWDDPRIRVDREAGSGGG